MRALEDHMFEKMRHAVDFQILIACAGPHKKTDGGRFGAFIYLADNRQTIFQLVAFEFHAGITQLLSPWGLSLRP